MSKINLIKGFYESPRITGEILDCSMPATFDTYSTCFHNCLYCFSTFQRGIGGAKENYNAHNVKVASIEKFKKMFTAPEKYGGNFKELIQQKITLQVGGLSDPFCPIEENLGLGYEFFKFLREIEYPLCFSSKGDLLLKNEKYLKLFEGAKNWSYKTSIITLDEEKAKKIELGVPTPQRRLDVLKKLSEMGIWTILRLRPFIPGVSNLDYEQLIEKAATYSNVKAMSTEFLCLELRATKIAGWKYKRMSEVCGFDLVQFYKNISTGSGYLRLNYEYKKPYFDKMKKLCEDLKINFHVSDAHGKEQGCSGSCCGLPQDESISKFSHCQFTNALFLASQKGEVRWCDISKQGEWMKGKFISINGLTAFAGARREERNNQTMFEIMRNIWNEPNNSKSPYKYFGGILQPIGLDENHDVIYKFNKEKV